MQPLVVPPSPYVSYQLSLWMELTSDRPFYFFVHGLCLFKLGFPKQTRKANRASRSCWHFCFLPVDWWNNSQVVASGKSFYCLLSVVLLHLVRFTLTGPCVALRHQVRFEEKVDFSYPIIYIFLFISDVCWVGQQCGCWSVGLCGRAGPVPDLYQTCTRHVPVLYQNHNCPRPVPDIKPVLCPPAHLLFLLAP